MITRALFVVVVVLLMACLCSVAYPYEARVPWEEVTYFAVVEIGGDSIAGVNMADSTVAISIDDGDTWATIAKLPAGITSPAVRKLWWIAGTFFVSADDSSVWRSQDRGRTWGEVFGPETGGGTNFQYVGFAYDPGTGKLCMGTYQDSAQVWCSTDGGDTWADTGIDWPAGDVVPAAEHSDHIHDVVRDEVGGRFIVVTGDGSGEAGAYAWSGTGTEIDTLNTRNLITVSPMSNGALLWSSGYGPDATGIMGNYVYPEGGREFYLPPGANGQTYFTAEAESVIYLGTVTGSHGNDEGRASLWASPDFGVSWVDLVSDTTSGTKGFEKPVVAGSHVYWYSRTPVPVEAPSGRIALLTRDEVWDLLQATQVTGSLAHLDTVKTVWKSTVLTQPVLRVYGADSTKNHAMHPGFDTGVYWGGGAGSAWSRNIAGGGDVDTSRLHVRTDTLALAISMPDGALATSYAEQAVFQSTIDPATMIPPGTVITASAYVYQEKGSGLNADLFLRLVDRTATVTDVASESDYWGESGWTRISLTYVAEDSLYWVRLRCRGRRLGGKGGTAFFDDVQVEMSASPDSLPHAWIHGQAIRSPHWTFVQSNWVSTEAGSLEVDGRVFAWSALAPGDSVDIPMNGVVLEGEESINVLGIGGNAAIQYRLIATRPAAAATFPGRIGPLPGWPPPPLD